ncbi:DUF3795 domain-containing protein [Wukongibacter baidiensis]|uniref:DUF3795 domain-containing protein n=1 Tax=Wukongibacter baidiensis TaxID=1723361 RepID=UPI003D7F4EBC
MDKKLVCPCGLTCCDCLFYKSEIFEAAKNLRDLIREYDFDTFLGLLSIKSGWEALGEHFDLSKDQAWYKIGKHFDTFNQMPEFMNVLDNIIKLQCKTTCQEISGCSIGGNTHKCSALKCIISKGYDGCWECEEFKNCEKLNLLKHNYGYVIEDNLKIIKEKGFEAISPRGNKYYSWQRKKYGCDT